MPVLLGIHGAGSGAPLTLEGSATTAVSWRNPPFVGSLPSNIQAGDLLLAFLATDDDPDGTTTRNYSLSGWTQLYYNILSGQGNGRARSALWARIATGSEGNSISIGGTGGCELAITTLRIRGWDDTQTLANAIALSSSATGFGTNPNPSSVSPPWGAGAQSLFIAASQSSGGFFQSTIPSGYDRRINIVSNGVPDGGGNQWNGCQILCFKNAQAASENPAAFGLYDDFAWAARTIAVRGKGDL